MSAPGTTAVLLAALLALGASACGGRRPAAREQQRAQAQADEALAATEEAAAGARAWAESLRTPGATPLVVAYSPSQLEQLVAQLVPHRMPASTFHRDLAGDVELEGIANVQLLPGNRLQLLLRFRGPDVRYRGQVPSFYRQEVARFQQGLAAGVDAALDVHLRLVGGEVHARARAMRADLRAHGSATFEGMLRDAMNERAFRLPLRVDVSVEGAGLAPRWLAVTPGHVAVGYGR